MEGLGIDPKILIGNILTFLVLLFVLKRFAYKPFLSILEQRKNKIAEGVQKSEEAEKSLAKIRTLADEVKEAGERKAKEIVVAAEKKAQEKTKSIMAAAEADKTKLMDNARQAMAKELAQAKEKQEKEAVNLAFSVAEKFLAQNMNKDQDKKLIERLASELK